MQLRDLTATDDRLIGGIIGRSFADDPVNLWIFKGEAGITPFYTRVARKLYLRQGFGHVIEDGSGGTLWLPPGKSKEIPLWNSLDIAASMLRHGGIQSLKNGMATDRCLLSRIPETPHYYLYAIGTLPKRQGEGIGSRLMQAGLQRADAARMPAYLESSKESNIPFYQRFGFTVTGEVQPVEGSPKLWLMWRDAC